MACFWFLSYQTLLRYFTSHFITNASMACIYRVIFLDILRGDYYCEYLPSPTQIYFHPEIYWVISDVNRNSYIRGLIIELSWLIPYTFLSWDSPYISILRNLFFFYYRVSKNGLCGSWGWASSTSLIKSTS